MSADELGILFAAAASSWINRNKPPLFSHRFNRVLHAALLTAVSFARGRLLAVHHLLCFEYYTVTVLG